MIERGYFGRAARIVLSDLPTFVVGGLILQVVSALSLGLLAGPAICGMTHVTLKHLRGEEVVFQDLFRSFERPGPAVAAGVFFIAVAGVGLVMLAVPGLILGGVFCFVFPLLADRRLGFSEALAASRRLPTGHDLLDRSLFFLCVLLVGLSGLALCLVGVLLTWPLMWAIVAVAYDDLAAREGAGDPPGLAADHQPA